MSARDTDLRGLLENFPRYELRKLLKEREDSFKSNKTEELIERLMEKEWSDQEKKNLVGRLIRVREESDPLGYWILLIEDHPDIHKFAEGVVSNNPVVYSEEDDDVPEESGYEISSSTDTRVEMTKWKVEREYEFDRITGRPSRSVDRSAVGFAIDIEDNRVYISTRNYGRAKSIRTLLIAEGFEFGDIGHKRINADQASDDVSSFIETVNARLEEEENS